MRFVRVSQELIPIRPLVQNPNLDRSAFRSPLRGWSCKSSSHTLSKGPDVRL